MEGQNRQEARECLSRALEALAGAEDEATRLSLWRLAKRYHGRLRASAGHEGLNLARSLA